MSAVAGGLGRVARLLILGGLTALSSWMPTADAQSASTAPPSASAPDAETLRQRAAAFWAARVAGDYNAQFDLLEPRGRGRMTAGELAGGRGSVKYLAYQVEDATPSGFFATVKVRLLVQPILPATMPNAATRRIPPQVSVIGDRWVRVGGVWYRSLEQDEAGPAAPAPAPR